MILYLNHAMQDPDDPSVRGAKLKGLERFFKEKDSAVLSSMLAHDALSPAKNSSSCKLIISAHANSDEMGGTDPLTLFIFLQSKGLQPGSFGSIYLMGCAVAGPTTQHHGHSFLVQFAALLKTRNINVPVYGLADKLNYLHKTDRDGGQDYFTIEGLSMDLPGGGEVPVTQSVFTQA